MSGIYYVVSQTIPAIGTGLVLICVIVLVVCFRYRRKSKKPSNDRPVVCVNEIKINLPYSPDNKYEERSSEIMLLLIESRKGAINV
uniref:Uncharacterized protein n=1 Tax=Magallana gigas TaxID=29159 RepID=K1RCU2_MAGGI